jgi:hypothetical protein
MYTEPERNRMVAALHPQWVCRYLGSERQGDYSVTHQHACMAARTAVSRRSTLGPEALHGLTTPL